MLTKIDTQLQDYDSRVGNTLQMISLDSQGRISVEDLQKALAVIKHKPDEEVGHMVIEKLDVDNDGFVELDHLLELVKEEGLGQCSFVSRNLTLILLQASLLMTKPRTCLGKGRRSRT
jgi:LETM1 and EF-hand domain-containing protein 1